MPIYEYTCSACKKNTEVIQKFSDAPLTVCTLCGKGPFERVISRTAFQLKGTGWYASDYKKPSGGSSSSSGSDKK